MATTLTFRYLRRYQGDRKSLRATVGANIPSVVISTDMMILLTDVHRLVVHVCKIGCDRNEANCIIEPAGYSALLA